MEILEIELEGYKRFPFLKEQSLKLCFPDERKLTLITGINGSGKSSLLSELTPYPANKSDLSKNGYKKITIQHTGKTYVLKNYVAEKESGYSFIVDDIELNTSGLLTMQKSLIESHFGLSQDMFDILLGKVNFTSLNKQQRKKLISQITHVDVDALIEKYEAIKEDIKLRELEIKQLRQRIVIEEGKLIDADKKAALDEEHGKLIRFIDKLLETRDYLMQYKAVDKVDDNTFISFMTRYKEFVRKHKIVIESYGKADVRMLIENESRLISSLQTKIEHLYSKLEELHQLKKKIDAVKNSSKEALESERSRISDELENLKRVMLDSKIVTIDLVSQQQIETTLHQIYYPIKELMDILPDNPNKELYNKELADKNEQELKALQDKRHILETQLEAHRSEFLYLEKKSTEGHTVCPMCHHGWIPEYDESRHKAIKDLIPKLEQELNEIKDKIKSCESYFQDYRNYVGIFSRYRAILQQHPMVKEFFIALEAKQTLFDNPRIVPTLYSETIERELQILRRYREASDKLKSLEEDLLKIHETSEVDKSSIDLKIRNEEELLSLYRYEKKLYEDYLADLRNIETILEHHEKIKAKIAHLTDLKKKSNLDQLVQEYISVIDNELRSSKIRLTEIETLLRDHQYVITIVENCRADLEKKEKELKLVSLIEKEFNPKTGLISQVISYFINSILVNMNNIISSIWSYDMKIVPYDLENDVLDYSFKVRVEDKLDISDISMVSSGMKEIINLAFKLTIMKLLKLEHFPLYIDEYGVNLDKEHRAKIHHLIMRLIKSGEYSRVFLINHEDDVGFSTLNECSTIAMS